MHFLSQLPPACGCLSTVVPLAMHTTSLDRCCCSLFITTSVRAEWHSTSGGDNVWSGHDSTGGAS